MSQDSLNVEMVRFMTEITGLSNKQTTTIAGLDDLVSKVSRVVSAHHILLTELLASVVELAPDAANQVRNRLNARKDREVDPDMQAVVAQAPSMMIDRQR
jgi:hypothetical protein